MTADAGNQSWDLFSDWEKARTGSEAELSSFYADARSRCPVQRVSHPNGNQFWTVIGQAEVDYVLNNPGEFSSAISHFGTAPRIPLELDPPIHADFRRAVNGVVNMAVAKALEVDTRRYVVETLEPFIAAGGGDIVPDATQLPLRVLCRLFGGADDEWKALEASQKNLRPADNLVVEHDLAKQRFELFRPVAEYAAGLVAKRKAAPGDDLVSKLLASNVEGRTMTAEEVERTLLLLMLAGHHTTGSTIAGSTYLLMRDAALQDKLRAHPDLIPQAVEECLRVHAAAQGLNRVATKDTVLGSASIKAGDHVIPVFAAANFDAKAFSSPELFDAERKPNRHYTFGKGIHLCVGAPIARMEIRIFIEELLARTSRVVIDDDLERETWPEISLKHLRLITS